MVMVKKRKKKKPLTFGQRLVKTIEKHQKKQRDNMALFRAEQRRQGVGVDEPIDLLTMINKKPKK